MFIFCSFTLLKNSLHISLRNLEMTKLFTLILIFVSLNTFGQIGWRRNSDGILFPNLIIFSSDYNGNDPSGNATGLCLPRETTGTICRIRNPFTNTTFSGTYGNYNAINCDLDHYAYLAVFVSMVFTVRRFTINSFTHL